MQDGRNAKPAMFGLSVLLLGIAFLAYYLIVLRYSQLWPGLFPFVERRTDLLWLLVGCAGSLLLFGLTILAPKRHYYMEELEVLINAFSLKTLLALFILNGFAEELLFRGALQVWLGILPATILFTVIHIGYFQKPLLLVNTFLIGLLLGFVFQESGSVWICALSHTFYNFTVTWLIKSGRINYCVH